MRRKRIAAFMFWENGDVAGNQTAATLRLPARNEPG
jgi:hypothetical protein